MNAKNTGMAERGFFISAPLCGISGQCPSVNILATKGAAGEIRAMKYKLLIWLGLACAPGALGAAEGLGAPSWHAQTLGQAIGYMLLFAGVGIVAAMAGYKLFDLCTPGNLNKEILENRNVAAAIVAGSVILGVCLIVAAAMLG